MNAYVCRINEDRGRYYTTGYEPGEPYWPIDVFVAATRGQARWDALQDFMHARGSAVEHEDFTRIQVRLLERDTQVQPLRGILDTAQADEYDRLWGRVHEVIDHDGRPCDCPTDDLGGRT